MIYLYIKQHSLTGLKYFGKTIRDPYKYDGSGVHWQRHINKHGKEHVQTLEVFEFTDQETAKNFALEFSSNNNIVESLDWANKIPEDALNKIYSEQSKAKMSNSRLGKIPWNKGLTNATSDMVKHISESKLGKSRSKETINKIKNKRQHQIISDEQKLKTSKTLSGKKKPQRSSEHSLKLSKSNIGKCKAVTIDGLCMTVTREEFYSNPSLVSHRSFEGRKRLESNSKLN
jgi:hypothetical protein